MADVNDSPLTTCTPFGVADVNGGLLTACTPFSTAPDASFFYATAVRDRGSPERDFSGVSAAALLASLAAGRTAVAVATGAFFDCRCAWFPLAPDAIFISALVALDCTNDCVVDNFHKNASGALCSTQDVELLMLQQTRYASACLRQSCTDVATFRSG